MRRRNIFFYLLEDPLSSDKVVRFLISVKANNVQGIPEPWETKSAVGYYPSLVKDFRRHLTLFTRLFSQEGLAVSQCCVPDSTLAQRPT